MCRVQLHTIVANVYLAVLKRRRERLKSSGDLGGKVVDV